MPISRWGKYGLEKKKKKHKNSKKIDQQLMVKAEVSIQLGAVEQ